MGVMPNVIPGSTNPVVAAAADAVDDLILARMIGSQVRCIGRWIRE